MTAAVRILPPLAVAAAFAASALVLAPPAVPSSQQPAVDLSFVVPAASVPAFVEPVRMDLQGCFEEWHERDVTAIDAELAMRMTVLPDRTVPSVIVLSGPAYAPLRICIAETMARARFRRLERPVDYDVRVRWVDQRVAVSTRPIDHRGVIERGGWRLVSLVGERGGELVPAFASLQTCFAREGRDARVDARMMIDDRGISAVDTPGSSDEPVRDCVLDALLQLDLRAEAELQIEVAVTWERGEGTVYVAWPDARR